MAVEDVGTRVIVSDARLLDQVRDPVANADARARRRRAQPAARAREPQRDGRDHHQPAARAVRQPARPLPDCVRARAGRRHAKQRLTQAARCARIASLSSVSAKSAAAIPSRWCNERDRRSRRKSTSLRASGCAACARWRDNARLQERANERAAKAALAAAHPRRAAKPQPAAPPPPQ